MWSGGSGAIGCNLPVGCRRAAPEFGSVASVAEVGKLMAMADAERALNRGRECFARRAWADAYAQLSAADREAPLEPEDLERLAMAAYLVGADE